MRRSINLRTYVLAAIPDEESKVDLLVNEEYLVEEEKGMRYMYVYTTLDGMEVLVREGRLCPW